MLPSHSSLFLGRLAYAGRLPRSLKRRNSRSVKVRQEIEALRSILPLLTDDEDDDVPVDGPVYPSLRVVNRE